jgi:hypothetical protein
VNKSRDVDSALWRALEYQVDGLIVLEAASAAIAREFLERAWLSLSSIVISLSWPHIPYAATMPAALGSLPTRCSRPERVASP